MDSYEELKNIFKDETVHIAIAIVKALHLADDRSFLKLTVSTFPDEIESIVRMSWDAVGPESGTFTFPSVNDLVLVAIAESDEDQGFVIKRLTSKEDKIPITAVDGATVIKALAGKKLWITSNNKILLSKGDTMPEENLILGKKFQEAYSEHLDNDAKHTHIDSMGSATTLTPTFKEKYEEIKASPVDDNKMLSDVAFTEKGS